MSQDRLFFDDVYQVLGELCARLGNKEVAYRLWPTKKNGYAWLRECLDPDKPGKINPQEFIELLKMGREIGVHSAMDYVCDEVGYSRPVPVEPADEQSELQRAFIEAVKQQKQIADRLESLQPSLRAVKGTPRL